MYTYVVVLCNICNSSTSTCCTLFLQSCKVNSGFQFKSWYRMEVVRQQWQHPTMYKRYWSTEEAQYRKVFGFSNTTEEGFARRGVLEKLNTFLYYERREGNRRGGVVQQCNSTTRRRYDDEELNYIVVLHRRGDFRTRSDRRVDKQ